MDLKLKITADASDAKKELASVEQGIQRVEKASTTGGNSVAKAMQTVGSETSKVNEATKTLSTTSQNLAAVNGKVVDTTKMSTAEWLAYQSQVTKASFQAEYAAAKQRALGVATAETAAAVKIAGVTVTTLTGILTGAGAVLLGLGALVVKSTQYYIEHADSQRATRAAIAETTTAWEAAQLVIGEAAIGHANAAKPINALNAIIGMGAIQIAAWVREANSMIETGARLVGLGGLFTATPPRPTPLKGSGAPDLGAIIDPNATAGDRMRANAQYLRDQAEMERARTQLMDIEFRKREELQRKHERDVADSESHIRDIILERFESTRKAGQAYYDIIHDAEMNGTQGMKLHGEVSLAVLNAEINKWLELRTTIQSVSAHVVSGVGNINLPGDFDIGEKGANLLPNFPKSIIAQAFGSSANFGKELAGAIMGAIQGGGNVVESAGSLIGSGLMGGLAKTITSGGGLAISGALGGALNAVLPGLGALLGPLSEKLLGWFTNLFGNQAKEEIEKSFGSYDALRGKIDSLTVAGTSARDAADAMWVELTQKTGKHDTEKAKQLISGITALLDAQKRQHEETARAAVNTAQATVDAQAKLIDGIKGRLGELDSEYNRLFQTIANEAPEEEMGIIEANTRAQLERIAETRKGVQAELDLAQKAQEENLAKLTEAMQRLNDTLKGLTANPWDIQVNYSTTGVAPSDGRPGTGGVDEENSFANGTDGYQWFGAGTPAMLHGWEKVVPLGKDSGGGSSYQVNVTFAQPVMATDHTSMEQFANFIGEAVEQKLRRERRL